MIRPLLYHDVVEPGREAESGFHGAGADRYKLTVAQFRSHLDAIDRSLGNAPSLGRVEGWQITFDDGGKSATRAADILEERGWHGTFFITTDRIGEPAFLDVAGIRELHGRGHVIGTHSCSHPARLSACPTNKVFQEWAESRRVLSEILGEAVVVGSVPGGYYSRAVAQAADAAGLRLLYTSEPSARCRLVGDCVVQGRFSIHRKQSAMRAALLARGDRPAVIREWLQWNARKALKRVAGREYLRVREFLLRHTSN